MSLVTREELKTVRDRVNPVFTENNLDRISPKTKLEVKEKRDQLDFEHELERINKQFLEI